LLLFYPPFLTLFHVTCFVQRHLDLRYLHSFPTRRSSDLNFTSFEAIACVPTTTFILPLRRPSLVSRISCADVARDRLPTSMPNRSEEHTSELQSRFDLVCRLLLEKKKISTTHYRYKL